MSGFSSRGAKRFVRNRGVRRLSHGGSRRPPVKDRHHQRSREKRRLQKINWTVPYAKRVSSVFLNGRMSAIKTNPEHKAAQLIESLLRRQAPPGRPLRDGDLRRRGRSDQAAGGAGALQPRPHQNVFARKQFALDGADLAAGTAKGWCDHLHDMLKTLSAIPPRSSASTRSNATPRGNSSPRRCPMCRAT